MFCTNCGGSISDDAAFCRHCGHSIVRVDFAPVTPVEPEPVFEQPVAADPVVDPFAFDKTVQIFEPASAPVYEEALASDPFEPKTTVAQDFNQTTQTAQYDYAEKTVMADWAFSVQSAAQQVEQQADAIFQQAQPVYQQATPVVSEQPVYAPAPVVVQPVVNEVEPPKVTKEKKKLNPLAIVIPLVAVIALAAVAFFVDPLGMFKDNGAYVVTQVVVTNGNASDRTVTYTYDSKGSRLSTLKDYVDASKRDDAFNDTYDSDGILTGRQREGSSLTEFTATVENGHVVKEVAKSAETDVMYVWKYTYDDQGNHIGTTYVETKGKDENGKDQFRAKKSYTYDTKGRLILVVTDAYGDTKASTVTYVYKEDSNGKVTGIVMDNGSKTEYTCETDANGNITKVLKDGTVVRQYTYTKIANPSQYCKDSFTQFEL